MNDVTKKLLKNQLFITGLILLLPAIICAIAAPWVAPHDPNQQILTLRLKPPIWQGGEPGYLLGTDALGRDLLSRVIYGARVSLTIGIAVVVVSSIVGTLIGVIAGYFGGILESLIMRIIDTFLAFPFLLLALAVMAVLKPGLWNLIMVLAFTSWVPYARVARVRTRALKRVEYVEAAVALAASKKRILRHHILPNIRSSLLIIGCFQIGSAMLAEATLSFLGLGISPDIPTWGMTLNEGRNYLLFAWWPTTIPGLFILITVFGINLIGDGVRDATDPKSRR